MMLLTLQIRDFALIENATIEFGEGLNVLSGETGAGKSILVQAIELLLGGRGSVDLIREGKDEAEVSGLFGSDREDGEEVSVRRIISRNGKSRAFLNERPVPVATLGEVSRDRVDLANQHEHQILLQPEQHLALLDTYAVLDHLVSQYREGLKDYKNLLVERESMNRREQETREKEEFLRFQLKELNEANVQEDEEETLKREREVLKHAVRLGEICLRGEEVLESGEGAITERLRQLLKDLEQASEIDPQLLPLLQQMEGSLCQLQEGATSLRQYGEKVSYDPERLQEVEDRSALLSRLKKKYGGSLENLMRKKEEIAQALTLLDHFEEGMQEKDRELEQKGKMILALAKKISETRKTAAIKLSKEIEKELKGLGMMTAKFSMPLQLLGAGDVHIQNQFLNENGMDTGEFLLAPNTGEGMKSLVKIVSGGEASRIFLALKKVLAGSSATMIFDEVDVGIGGGIAEVVGKNLAELSQKKQVICVTHLPQIACFGSQHFMIQKHVEKGRTRTEVERLDVHQREEEIARMMAGVKITDQAKAHAREMLRQARQAR